jgi:mRNA interferase YafQ
MKYFLQQTKTYRKDLRRIQRRSKNLSKLNQILRCIQQGRPLLPKHQIHVLLIGKYNNAFELHIEADWLLVYHLANNCLRLIRTGTHSDIF